MKFPPRNFFLNVAAMATLFISAISLITLLFQYVNVLFPDPLQTYYDFDPYSGAIRFAIASLIVVFPLYVLFTRMVHQDIRQNPELRDNKLRTWLIYITLFVAGATIAGDLVALINTFLSGELTTRFLLKVLIILLVAGGGFAYYLYELRGVWERKERESKIIGSIVSLVVALSIVSGFFIIGSPMEERALRFDRDRMNDLSSIQSTVVMYWQQKEELPQTLDALEDPLIGYLVPVDPESGESYRYRVISPLSFELCTNFNLPSDERSLKGRSSAAIDYYGIEGTWEHEAGEACFTRTIDPERFPPFRIQKGV